MWSPLKDPFLLMGYRLLDGAIKPTLRVLGNRPLAFFCLPIEVPRANVSSDVSETLAEFSMAHAVRDGGSFDGQGRCVWAHVQFLWDRRDRLIAAEIEFLEERQLT